MLRVPLRGVNAQSNTGRCSALMAGDPSIEAYLLYANWLNYCVYQGTPYDRTSIGRD